MSTATVAETWLVREKKLDSLVKRGREVAYDVAVLLLELEADEEYRAAKEAAGIDWQLKLAQCASEFGLSLGDVRNMLKTYPDKKDWKEGSLSRMRAKANSEAAKARAEQQSTEPSSNGEDKARSGFSWKARCKELEEKCARLEEKVEALESENQRLTKLVNKALAKKSA